MDFPKKDAQSHWSPLDDNQVLSFSKKNDEIKKKLNSIIQCVFTGRCGWLISSC